MNTLITLNDVVAFAIASIILMISGYFIDLYLKTINGFKWKDESNQEILEEYEKAYFLCDEEKKHVKVLGFFERFFFFIILLSGHIVILAGWLAFKLASKWQVWSSILKHPESFNNGSDKMFEFRIRNSFGSMILQKWLLGVLLNLIASIVTWVCFIQITLLIN